jgi:hypothetical protein
MHQMSVSDVSPDATHIHFCYKPYSFFGSIRPSLSQPELLLSLSWRGRRAVFIAPASPISKRNFLVFGAIVIPFGAENFQWFEASDCLHAAREMTEARAWFPCADLAWSWGGNTIGRVKRRDRFLGFVGRESREYQIGLGRIQTFQNNQH